MSRAFCLPYIATLLLLGCSSPQPAEISPIRPATTWIRPSGAADASPIWGLSGGITVGLWPTDGPRGLIRIYTPYLHQPAGRIMEFIAVEPIVEGRRDLSEMQKSTDGKPGKMMWTADQIDPAAGPVSTNTHPARGIVTTENGVDTLSFYILVERFDNGAQPIIRVSIRSDRPHEICLQTFAAPGSAGMSSCVLTATMGNWSRLRHVYLKDSVVTSTELFKGESRDSWRFFPWRTWDAGQPPGSDGSVTFQAIGETDATPKADTPLFWRYIGEPARQCWRTASCSGLVARVNGRSTFWGSAADIPGGPAFENFELKSPYSAGQKFFFGVDPLK